MNKESLLKKEFTQRDVQRMRNLVTKKFGERTRIQSGYLKVAEVRQEGDIWEENGKTWTIKSGIKQNITKFDSLKKLVVLPLTCPKCGHPMKITELNKKMYSLHTKCFDCVVKEETALKAVGEYAAYEAEMLKLNRDSQVEHLEKALNAWLEDSEEFITEQGDIEDWQQSSKTEMYNQAKEVLEKVKNAPI